MKDEPGTINAPQAINILNLPVQAITDAIDRVGRIFGRSFYIVVLSALVAGTACVVTWVAWGSIDWLVKDEIKATREADAKLISDMRIDEELRLDGIQKTDHADSEALGARMKVAEDKADDAHKQAWLVQDKLMHVEAELDAAERLLGFKPPPRTK